MIKNWQFLVAIFAAGVSWGASQVQIEGIKDDAAKNTEARENAIRVDERTKQMQEEQKEQRVILMEILQRLPQN